MKSTEALGGATTPAALQGENVYIYLFFLAKTDITGEENFDNLGGGGGYVCLVSFGKQADYIKDFELYFSRIFTFACPNC